MRQSSDTVLTIVSLRPSVPPSRLPHAFPPSGEEGRPPSRPGGGGEEERRAAAAADIYEEEGVAAAATVIRGGGGEGSGGGESTAAAAPGLRRKWKRVQIKHRQSSQKKREELMFQLFGCSVTTISRL